ncbi:GntR family transcriptional regulator [Oceanobacillus bengalensis]|uniref:GntR family transcriptional regulator n=1 Tax=Oceanobacillus bengalensis TaxID=1435466 RepID=A0A494YZK0_9BACI|nr:GntR family transcriptional regulator [Oceanobacillus bengalensis]RKQ15678.1 GntR family transcriptional regulator [Oceanobacillus bengalensis]
MKTKHSIVREFIKSKILDGTYVPNQKISSESELMERFNVSRHTVRLAIGDLVNQGWLYRKQGAGTYCAERTEMDASKANQKNIAIITTHISDYIFPSIIRGAESHLSKNDYHVSLFSTDNNHGNEKQILEKLLTHHIDGVIIEPTQSAMSNPNINYYLNLEKLNIPYIMINAYYDELEPLSITIDDEKGGFLQTEHLIEQGHHNILGFFKTDDIQGTRRMKGYLKAHRKNQVQIKPSNIITYHTEEKMTKPREELEEILSQTGEDRPTAIVCYNDELAMILLDVLREKNVKVPEDISLIGFDDSVLSRVSEVKLTTVRHPQSEMGETAAKMMLNLLDIKHGLQPDEKVSSIVYEPQLVVRNSTKDIRELV